MDASSYLDRLGVAPEAVRDGGLDALRRLQRAHVRTVPFENLAIVGDPFGEHEGDGVTLALPALYEKVVTDERGGFCFELNGLFGWLLSDLGFESTRLAACVLGDDGTARPPANHHTNVVSLDRRYVVDVGLGVPPMRRPLPLDGTPQTDETGVTWRIVESDRPDADYLTQVRTPGDEEWTDRYVFRDEPRDLRFFEATCEYLATAPESTFTDHAIVSVATEDGYAKLSGDTLSVTADGETTERTVPESDWHDELRETFGLSL